MWWRGQAGLTLASAGPRALGAALCLSPTALQPAGVSLSWACPPGSRACGVEGRSLPSGSEQLPGCEGPGCWGPICWGLSPPREPQGGGSEPAHSWTGLLLPCLSPHPPIPSSQKSFRLLLSVVNNFWQLVKGRVTKSIKKKIKLSV